MITWVNNKKGLTVRFVILFLLLITNSWAMDDDSEKSPYLAIQISDTDGIVWDASPWDEEESANEDPSRSLLAHDSLDISAESERNERTSRQRSFLECRELSDLADDVFFIVILKSMDMDLQSILDVFMTSKGLRQKLTGKVFPAHSLSSSPSFFNVLYVIQDMEERHKFLGPRIKDLLCFPKYKTDLERLERTKSLLVDSPLFCWLNGSERIEDILSHHQLKPSDTPAASRLRQFWSSMARDPLTFTAGAITTLSSTAILAWQLYALYQDHQINIQAHERQVEQLRQNLYTWEYMSQYYFQDHYFPHSTPGCQKIMEMAPHSDHLCFGMTGYCQKNFSSFANITQLADTIWTKILKSVSPVYLNLPDFYNVSLNTIQSIFQEFFEYTCSGIQMDQFFKNHGYPTLMRSSYIERLKPNSTVFLLNLMENRNDGWACEHQWNVGPNLATMSPYLYYCDPQAMYGAVPGITRAITGYSIGITTMTFLFIGLIVELFVGV
jgi:hypothetical protein